VAAWLFIGGALLVALLLLFGRGQVDEAAADLNENDTAPLPDQDDEAWAEIVNAYGQRGSAA